jgi:DNA-binding LacI/PurR family transcriptional regulator
VPFVTIDGEESEAAVNIGIRNDQAAYDLMRYILSLKPNRIAVLRLKPDAKSRTERSRSVVLEKRLEGFSRALGEVGLSLGSDRISMIEAEGSMEGGREAGRVLLGTADRPDAIVAMADIVAIGVYSAADEYGIRIPEELSVAGFDDIPLSRFCRPPLTTIHQPAKEKGRKAASLAIAILNGGVAEHYTLPYTLEIRGSTKPLR